MHHAILWASPHLTANQPSAAGGKCSPSSNCAVEAEGKTVNCSCRNQACHLSLICCLLLEMLLSCSPASTPYYLLSYQQSFSVRKCAGQMSPLESPSCAYRCCSNFCSLNTGLVGISSTDKICTHIGFNVHRMTEVGSSLCQPQYCTY